MYKAYYIERDYIRVTGKTAGEDIDAYKAFLAVLQNSGKVPVSVFTRDGKPYIWIIVDTDTNIITNAWYYNEDDYDEAEDGFYDACDNDYESDEIEEAVLEDALIKALITKKDSFIGGLY